MEIRTQKPAININGTNSNIKYLNFDATTAPAYQQGRVWYDNQTRSLCYYDEHSGTSIQLGKELVIDARNNTGATILNGKVVHISGAVGQHSTIALARADSIATCEIIGIATHDIPDGTIGKITIIGDVSDIDTSMFSDGQNVYLSATVAGDITGTPPASPHFVVKVGTVEYAHAGNGVLSVGISDPLANNNNLGNSQIVAPTQNAVKEYIDNNASGILSIVAGSNITVDNTDPLNPIVSATSGGTTNGGVIEVDFGANGDVQAVATLTDPAIVSGSALFVSVKAVDTANNSADDIASQLIDVKATNVVSGSCDIIVSSVEGILNYEIPISYLIV